MWKTSEERGRPQMKTWRMRIVCWIPKATNIHTVCLILIAFPLQQLVHERSSTLRFTYITCLVSSYYASYSKISILSLELIHVAGVYRNLGSASEGNLFVSITRSTV